MSKRDLRAKNAKYLMTLLLFLQLYIIPTPQSLVKSILSIHTLRASFLFWIGNYGKELIPFRAERGLHEQEKTQDEQIRQKQSQGSPANGPASPSSIPPDI